MRAILPKLSILLSVPLLAAMGDPKPPPGPVQLPRVDAPAAPAPAAPVPEPGGPALEVLAAVDTEPAAFRTIARPLVVFADSADDPAFVAQLAMLEDRPAGLVERDVVVITDVDPAARSPAWPSKPARARYPKPPPADFSRARREIGENG